jgi:tetraprenyl-beta-curcumene synthase
MSIDRVTSLAPKGPVSLMLRYYRYVLPEVRHQLADWRRVAEQIPDEELRKQALLSIDTKQFHCEGGVVYATADLANRHLLIPLIVAFQTISDYLDNLCDRSTSLSGDDFRKLHQSMLDAVDPSAVPDNYYELHQEQNDGDYLIQLVRTCQSCICLLPSYDQVQPFIQELVGLYCDLQVYKHIDPSKREEALAHWWDKHKEAYPDLLWNEFAAATGSTLGVFMLFLAASRKSLRYEDPAIIRNVYFPYICGLHILLDYLIDQEEDREGGDLNFCKYYASPEMAAERIGHVADEARSKLKILKDYKFHRMIVEGLLALYLSDPKAANQPNVRKARRLLMKKSPLSRIFFWVNTNWVRKSH